VVLDWEPSGFGSRGSLQGEGCRPKLAKVRNFDEQRPLANLGPKKGMRLRISYMRPVGKIGNDKRRSVRLMSGLPTNRKVSVNGTPLQWMYPNFDLMPNRLHVRQSDRTA
jgi:hypothetical protein